MHFHLLEFDELAIAWNKSANPIRRHFIKPFREGFERRVTNIRAILFLPLLSVCVLLQKFIEGRLL